MTTSRRDFLSSTGLGLAALGLPSLHLASASPYDLIIRGAAVYGGKGLAGAQADVGIRAGRIAAVAKKVAGTGSSTSIRMRTAA